MTKKIILLALTAIGAAAMFALPAVASAEDIPLHVVPAPSGSKTIDNATVGAPTLSVTNGETITCETFGGSATFENGTTGHMNLTFSGHCQAAGASCNSPGAAAGTIVTTELPFHLVTLANEKPGVLVTPNASGAFAHIECAFGFIKFTVTGNGVIGTITQPACGAKSSDATIDFNATANGVQEHTTVAGTTTEYSLEKGTNKAAQDATGTLTLGTESTLECT